MSKIFKLEATEGRFNYFRNVESVRDFHFRVGSNEDIYCCADQTQQYIVEMHHFVPSQRY